MLRMLRAIRHLAPMLLLLAILLAACTQATGAVGQGKAGATPIKPFPQGGNTTCPPPLTKVAGCFTPYTLRSAYSIEPLFQRGFTGQGQTVIDIVSFGSPTLQQDMVAYDKAVGLPPADLQIIAPLKNTPEYDPRGEKGSWAIETTMDVQIIHAIAPGAKIIVLISPVAETEGTIGLPQFRQLERYVIDHQLGKIVSQSWGASEVTLQDQQGQQERSMWGDVFQEGTTQHGITYFSASGDNGSTDVGDIAGTKISPVATTTFAADSPWVTGVGGTTLTRQNATFSERGWTQSGGGVSRFYQEPDYQRGLPATMQRQLHNRRGVPDVAAVADNSTNLAIYVNGQWGLAGGTSAAAPVWSGLLAIANQMAGRPLGFINPALYKIAATNHQDFRDITAGNNTYKGTTITVPGYAAQPGWDLVTGLGTPNAEKLVPDLIAATK